MIYDIGFYMEHMLYSYIINLLPKSSRPTVDSIHVNRSQTESDCLFLLKKTIYATDMAPRLPLWELRKLTRCQLLN